MPTEVLALVFDRLTPDARALAYRAALGYTDGNVRADRIVGVFGLDLSLIPYQGYTRDLEAVRKALDAFANRATSQFSGSAGGSRAACRPAGRCRRRSVQRRAGSRGRRAWCRAGRGRHGRRASRDADGGDAIAHAADVRHAGARPAGYSTANAPDGGRLEHADHARPQSLVFFSEGLAIPPNVQERFIAVVAAANRANVSIYPMDAAGLRTESTSKETRDEHDAAASETTCGATPRGRQQAPMTAGAGAQRGPPAHGSAQRPRPARRTDRRPPDRQHQRLPPRPRAHRQRHAELLHAQLRAENDEFDGKFREIAVKVKRPGVDVAAPQGLLRRACARRRARARRTRRRRSRRSNARRCRTRSPFRRRAAIPRGGPARPHALVVEVPTAGLTFQPRPRTGRSIGPISRSWCASE